MKYVITLEYLLHTDVYVDAENKTAAKEKIKERGIEEIFGEEQINPRTLEDQQIINIEQIT